MTFDLDCPVGARVRGLEILCSACLVPQLEPVQQGAQYRVAMPRFISRGGDGYDVIRDNKLAEINASE